MRRVLALWLCTAMKSGPDTKNTIGWQHDLDAGLMRAVELGKNHLWQKTTDTYLASLLQNTRHLSEIVDALPSSFF